jgi:hypothetical protein
MLRITLFCVVFAISSAAQASTVVWSSTINGIDLPNGTDTPVGSLVRIGTFNVTDALIVQHDQDMGYLNEHFIEFASALIGEGTQPAGHFQASSTNSTATAAALAGSQIYVWAFSTGNVFTATAHGIFYMPKDTDADWQFPVGQLPPNDQTQIGLGDLTDDATHTSKKGNAKFVIGDLGPGTSSSTGKPNLTLVAVPEPGSMSILLAASSLLGCVRRRR